MLADRPSQRPASDRFRAVKVQRPCSPETAIHNNAAMNGALEKLLNAAHRILPFYLAPLLCMVGLSGKAYGEHNALLPRPQEIHYGSSRLLVKGLRIHLPSSATDEDWFSARLLSGCLSRRIGMEIPIVQSLSEGPSISLTRTGAVDALPMPDETPGPDSREAYSINIVPGGGEVRGRSSAGVFYGVDTLCQMVEGNREDAALPESQIHDWPELAYRGTMVDMSEGPLPTEAEVERQIEFLSRWKANQYYFYSETSIELDGYPLVSEGARFTKDQIRRIVAYSRERHIDLVPCLELYGHLHDLFRVEKYSGLADFPHGGEFNPRNPEVMRLLNDWSEQFVQLFPSAFVQIGFDETWEIQKAAMQQGGGTTATQLFIAQLNNVSRLFEQHGKRVMAWADIMVKYPSIVSQLPSGLIAVPWWYEPIRDPEYKRWLAPLVEKAVPHIVAAGVNGFTEIVPDFELSFENIDTFLAAARKSKALGLMNTIWTDDAQLLIRMMWPGMAYGAVAAWQATPVDHGRFFPDYSRQVYSVEQATTVAPALEKLAEAEVDLQKALGQDTMVTLWDDPFTEPLLKRCSEHREDLRQARLLAEEAEERLDRALATGADATGLDSLLLGAHLIDYAGMKFLYAVEIADRWRALGSHPSHASLESDFVSLVASQQHGRLVDLMDILTQLQSRYQQAWLAEYTQYRLGEASARWDVECQHWVRVQRRLEVFSSRYRKEQPLPDLESLMTAE